MAELCTQDRPATVPPLFCTAQVPRSSDAGNKKHPGFFAPKQPLITPASLLDCISDKSRVITVSEPAPPFPSARPVSFFSAPSALSHPKHNCSSRS
ncbi:hypothetical protein J4E89_010088 [Alternaria sp. Ai002NY15]|nr:hypothetical protein J4E89_010088 [Alternaria sp. Ai002NY15]